MADTFKNAGLKSTEEDIKQALKRMIDGEVFYYEDQPVRFHLDRLMSGAIRCFSTGIKVLDRYELRNLDKWQVRVDWRENIGEGVWCWCWWVYLDEIRPHPELIKQYVGKGQEFPYIDSYGTGWKYAEPMAREEVEKYIL